MSMLHLRFATLVAATVLLSGCAVGPDFLRPAPPKASGYTPEPLPSETASADVAGGRAQRFVANRDIPAQWWTLFQSEPLNTLIRRSLEANPGLQAAEAALRGAREQASAQEGAFFPSVTGGVSALRQKNATGAVSPSSASGAPLFNLYTTQVSVSYLPDVFGANRRAVESLDAQAEAQQFQLEAAQLTLTANVVAAAVQEASLRGQITATEEIIKIETDLLVVLKRQNSLGQVAQADVLAQDAALAQASQLLPPLQKQLAIQRDLLAALTGSLSDCEPVEKFELAALRLPEELLLSLPSQLVEQRPDIRAAEANLRSASAEIGVAIANRLPNITLTAASGSSPAQLGRMFTPGNGFWSVGAALTQPLFDGFSLLHKERAARAAYDQAEAQYRATVVAAFQNVADTLRALQSDADALAAAARAEQSASQSLAITRKQLDLGQIAYLALLNAEQTELQARISLVQAEANRLEDTAALFQALGGGWWHRDN